MEAAIGLIGTVIGACIAGAFMYFKDKQQIDFDKQKCNKELLLAKYEHIYKDLNAYSAFANEVSMLMLSTTGSDEIFDVKKLKTNLINNHLIMNVMFYAPQLSPMMTEVNKKQENVVRAVGKFIMHNEQSLDVREKLTADAVIASAELTKNIKKAQEQLATLVIEQINA